MKIATDCHICPGFAIDSPRSLAQLAYSCRVPLSKTQYVPVGSASSRSCAWCVSACSLNTSALRDGLLFCCTPNTFACFYSQFLQLLLSLLELSHQVSNQLLGFWGRSCGRFFEPALKDSPLPGAQTTSEQFRPVHLTDDQITGQLTKVRHEPNHFHHHR